MNTSEKLKKWAHNMDLNHKLGDEELNLICNPASYHVWEQVMEKIKSKAHIRQIRKELMEFESIKSKETALYQPETSLSILKDKIKKLKTQIDDKSIEMKRIETKLKTLSDDNNIDNLKIMKLEQKKKENNKSLLVQKQILTNHLNNTSNFKKHLETIRCLKPILNKEVIEEDLIGECQQEIKKQIALKFFKEDLNESEHDTIKANSSLGLLSDSYIYNESKENAYEKKNNGGTQANDPLTINININKFVTNFLSNFNYRNALFKQIASDFDSEVNVTKLKPLNGVDCCSIFEVFIRVSLECMKHQYRCKLLANKRDQMCENNICIFNADDEINVEDEIKNNLTVKLKCLKEELAKLEHMDTESCLFELSTTRSKLIMEKEQLINSIDKTVCEIRDVFDNIKQALKDGIDLVRSSRLFTKKEELSYLNTKAFANELLTLSKYPFGFYEISRNSNNSLAFLKFETNMKPLQILTEWLQCTALNPESIIISCFQKKNMIKLMEYSLSEEWETMPVFNEIKDDNVFNLEMRKLYKRYQELLEIHERNDNKTESINKLIELATTLPFDKYLPESEFGNYDSYLQVKKSYANLLNQL